MRTNSVSPPCAPRLHAASCECKLGPATGAPRPTTASTSLGALVCAPRATTPTGACSAL
uniref:Uncharacterized protein n=1 Tax=Arundo donax TaxID=35708 RepID=A0A0A9AXK7_ARUDO